MKWLGAMSLQFQVKWDGSFWGDCTLGLDTSLAAKACGL